MLYTLFMNDLFSYNKNNYNNLSKLIKSLFNINYNNLVIIGKNGIGKKTIIKLIAKNNNYKLINLKFDKPIILYDEDEVVLYYTHYFENYDNLHFLNFIKIKKQNPFIIIMNHEYIILKKIVKFISIYHFSYIDDNSIFMKHINNNLIFKDILQHDIKINKFYELITIFNNSNINYMFKNLINNKNSYFFLENIVFSKQYILIPMLYENYIDYDLNIIKYISIGDTYDKYIYIDHLWFLIDCKIFFNIIFPIILLRKCHKNIFLKYSLLNNKNNTVMKNKKELHYYHNPMYLDYIPKN